MNSAQIALGYFCHPCIKKLQQSFILPIPNTGVVPGERKAKGCDKIFLNNMVLGNKRKRRNLAQGKLN